MDSPMDSGTMTETVDLIKSRISDKQFTQHVVVNVAKIVNMRKDRALSESVTECDIINIDGMGVVWGARFLGHQVPERVAGVDLFHSLNAMAEEESFP
ncbi:N-acetylmannosaminyltransferase, partial [Vibrio tubiashii ATCC 19109]